LFFNNNPYNYEYQKLVEEILGKSNEIEKKVTEKREKDKNVPNEKEVKQVFKVLQKTSMKQ